MIPLTQISDHNFNLGVTEQGGSLEDILDSYADMNGLINEIEGQGSQQERLERLLAAMTQRLNHQQAMLFELGIDAVVPDDAIKIIKSDALCPNDEILDSVAEAVGKVDSIVEDYTLHLEQSGETFLTPLPVLAKFVIGTTVLNDSEEQI